MTVDVGRRGCVVDVMTLTVQNTPTAKSLSWQMAHYRVTTMMTSVDEVQYYSAASFRFRSIVGNGNLFVFNCVKFTDCGKSQTATFKYTQMFILHLNVGN